MITDHQPLVALLGPKAPIPTLAAALMQCWVLVLSAYDHQIEYRRSEKHANSDALYRLPHEDSKKGSEGETYSVSAIDKDFLKTAKDIGKVTSLDPVLDFVMTGWPENYEERF